MLPTNLLNLLAVCLLSLRTPSATALSPARSPARALQLLSRQSSQCATTGYSPCNKAGLPGNFCCPANQQCIAFNNNKSALCCPSGQDCKTIAPVSCDLTKQDVSKSPAGGLHTTDLTGELAKCGSNCCPQGYSCQNNNCVVQSSSTSSKPASTASHTSTGSATPSTSTPKSTSATPTHSAIPGSADAQPQCSKIPGAAVAIGLIAGIIIGILLTITVICLIGRHNKKKDPPQKSSASIFSSVGQPPSISDPMPHYQQNGELRNDFLRKNPNPTNVDANAGYGRNRASSRVRSLFTRSPTFKNAQNGYGGQQSPTDGIGRTLQSPMQSPVRNGVRREPSTESIKIYSPQNDGLGRVPQRPETTFSGMIRQADLPPNLTFLNSPTRPDPRSRGVGH
ncbi:MAG: hypothetical protein HETSPECPRED_006111 [Heterodermia speciosa]|uniref:Mid2 domain-containing protein n=1 Tax=Heterodermia speciosa TaxID=116794 RepID=A0A8H3EKL7_9LECA|nr:MAG: hypothetical protein HETSPECPRED_006111 [Heterodermia speciosa]